MSKRTKTDKRGIERSIPINNKRKAGLYRDLERSVMNQVWDYLERNSVRHLKEHDGWTSDKPCDLDQIISEIKEKTGFSVRFQIEVIS